MLTPGLYIAIPYNISRLCIIPVLSVIPLFIFNSSSSRDSLTIVIWQSFSYSSSSCFNSGSSSWLVYTNSNYSSQIHYTLTGYPDTIAKDLVFHPRHMDYINLAPWVWVWFHIIFSIHIILNDFIMRLQYKRHPNLPRFLTVLIVWKL